MQDDSNNDPESTAPVATTVSNQSKPKGKSKGTRVLIIVGITVLVIGVGVGSYFWQESRIARLNADHTAEIKKLTQDNHALQKTIDELKNAASSDKTTSTDTESLTDAVNNIHDAITSRNYAALESRMTSTVEVVLAASEYGGNKTPTEAVKSLDYLKSAIGTWSFSIPMSVLTDWHSGYYASYLPTDGGIIGMSSDGYVVALTLNSNNKITKIFMATEEVM